MKSVTYVKGRAKFRRIFRPKDLAQLGIPYKDENLVFCPENKFTVVLNNKVSDSLVAAFPDDFRAYPVDGDDESPVAEVQEPLTSLTPEVQAQEPDEQTDESVSSGDDDAKSSKRSSTKTQ